MANVLTKGQVLTDHLWMHQIWAWTQCIAIDGSVAGTIIRTFRFYHEGEKVKTWLYGLLSVLLLFTAAIVSNIEAVQQTLNITLNWWKPCAHSLHQQPLLRKSTPRHCYCQRANR